MTDPTLPTGPDPEAIITYLMTTYPETDVVTIPAAWFFSLDPDKHWPNYATIVTNDGSTGGPRRERPAVTVRSTRGSGNTFDSASRRE